MKRIKLRCPICKREVCAYHMVQLDEMNTVIHYWCNKNEENSLLPIKDRGIFKELKNKYTI